LAKKKLKLSKTPFLFGKKKAFFVKNPLKLTINFFFRIILKKNDDNKLYKDITLYNADNYNFINILFCYFMLKSS